MKVTAQTKVKEILDAYPWMKDELIKSYPKLKLLNTPLANTLIQNVDIQKVSDKTNVEVDEIIIKIENLIESKN